MVRPDDGPIGPKHVALYVLLMVIIDVLDENINTLFFISLFFIYFVLPRVDKTLQTICTVYVKPTSTPTEKWIFN